MDKGFLVVAQNTQDVDYIKCAEVLGASIKKHMPDMHVSLVTNYSGIVNHFDNIIKLPQNKKNVINHFQIYELSPYKFTIKIDADIFLNSKIDHWFDTFKYKDIVLCSTIREFNQEIYQKKKHREFIDDNNLPNVYSAITYFSKSKTAEKFFKLVKFVSENWNNMPFQYYVNKKPKLDWIYSYVANMMGVGEITIPDYTDFSFVDMDLPINDLELKDWTSILKHEILSDVLRIDGIPQHFPLHYSIKKFASILHRSLAVSNERHTSAKTVRKPNTIIKKLIPSNKGTRSFAQDLSIVVDKNSKTRHKTQYMQLQTSIDDQIIILS